MRASPTRIPTRALGGSGIEVGVVGLGCMGMTFAYGSSDERECVAVIDRAIELGVTLLDTADAYGPFTNEALLGRALAGRRDDVVLATKCGLVTNDAATFDMSVNGHPDHIRSSCEGSLRRLATDVIDLYQLHRVDPRVPVAESVGAMAELVQAGTVRALGMSACTVAELEQARAVHPIASLQVDLSLWSRGALDELVPYCAEHDIAFLAYAPLGNGFLTGRYRTSDAFEAGDFRTTQPRFQPGVLEQNLELVDRVEQLGRRLGATPAQVALAWTIAQAETVVPIPGTKHVRYLEENSQAGHVLLDEAALAALDALPQPVGARRNSDLDPSLSES